jgi:hypothetical protein
MLLCCWTYLRNSGERDGMWVAESLGFLLIIVLCLVEQLSGNTIGISFDSFHHGVLVYTIRAAIQRVTTIHVLCSSHPAETV